MNRIYTDGSCAGTPGSGGWAVVIVGEGSEVSAIRGGRKSTHSSTMEMQALYQALLSQEALSKPKVYVDSSVLFGMCQKYLRGGSVKAGRFERSLWPKVCVELDRVGPEVEWIRRDSQPMNRLADFLAREQTRLRKFIEAEGLEELYETKLLGGILS